jgi:PHD/YefM family antitoxin component YafN of YafNO toxin-antitoxin module
MDSATIARNDINRAQTSPCHPATAILRKGRTAAVVAESSILNTPDMDSNDSTRHDINRAQTSPCHPATVILREGRTAAVVAGSRSCSMDSATIARNDINRAQTSPCHPATAILREGRTAAVVAESSILNTPEMESTTARGMASIGLRHHPITLQRSFCAKDAQQP